MDDSGSLKSKGVSDRKLRGLRRKIGVFNKKLGVYEGFGPGWGFRKEAFSIVLQ